MCHHGVVESKLEGVPLIVGETELSGSALIQRVPEGVVEHEDICRSCGAITRILNGDHERWVCDRLEPSGSDDGARIPGMQGGDCRVPGKRRNDVVDHAAVAEKALG